MKNPLLTFILVFSLIYTNAILAMQKPLTQAQYLALRGASHRFGEYPNTEKNPTKDYLHQQCKPIPIRYNSTL